MFPPSVDVELWPSSACRAARCVVGEQIIHGLVDRFMKLCDVRPIKELEVDAGWEALDDSVLVPRYRLELNSGAWVAAAARVLAAWCCHHAVAAAAGCAAQSRCTGRAAASTSSWTSPRRTPLPRRASAWATSASSTRRCSATTS